MALAIVLGAGLPSHSETVRPEVIEQARRQTEAQTLRAADGTPLCLQPGSPGEPASVAGPDGLPSSILGKPPRCAAITRFAQSPNTDAADSGARSPDTTELAASPHAASVEKVCAAFETETEFVEFDLWLDLQDKYVRLRFPASYVDEPREYLAREARPTSLIRVDINTFEPVSRYEDHLRFKAGNYDSMSILFSDRVSLEQQARIHANLATRKRQNVDENYPERPGPYGLFQLDYQSDKDETFVARDFAKRITDVFWCNAAQAVRNPGCSQKFKLDGVNVIADYSRKFLRDWQTIHARIETFLRCSMPSYGR